MPKRRGSKRVGRNPKTGEAYKPKRLSVRQKQGTRTNSAIKFGSWRSR